MQSPKDSIHLDIETSGAEITEKQEMQSSHKAETLSETYSEQFTDYYSHDREDIDTHSALPVYQAALEGDWETAARFLRESPTLLSYPITGQGDTALHVAAAAGNVTFVQNLVIRMRSIDLGRPNRYGNTALSLAAASGVVKIAKAMCEKNRLLPLIRGSDGMTPLYVAALLGHKEMVSYLYAVTPIDEMAMEEKRKLLLATTVSDMYDIALEILMRNRGLATFRIEKEKTALHVLARKTPSSKRQLPGILILSVLQGFEETLKDFRNRRLIGKKDQLYHQLVKALWEDIVPLPDREISMLITEPSVLHEAAEVGNVEFLVHLIQSYPDLIWKVDENLGSIFHCAVLYRQECVFSLIYEIGAYKDLLLSYEDKDGNNIVHMAAMLPPPSQLNIVSGAALQMQRELLWFKEVKKLVWPSYLKKKNYNGYTPDELFRKQHNSLEKEGEKWMKEMASSSILVATLIATVMFAAAFSVPGGNSDQSGRPNLSQRSSFKFFIISDALALVFSTTSIALFLSILTSRYAEMNFLVSLPVRLMLGLTSIFCAVAGMLLAFIATIILVYEDEVSWLPGFVGGLAYLSISCFGYLHAELLSDTLRVTRQSIMPKYVFRKGERKLFNRQNREKSYNVGAKKV